MTAELTQKDHLFSFFLYFLLSVILTYPLLFLFESHWVIGPQEDNLQSLWNPWHVQRAFLESDESLFHTRYLFYPKDFSLTMHTLSLSNAFFEAFLNFFFPLSYCYNLTIFLSFLLSAYFTFLFCYELTQDKQSSFLGGIIFAFCPYHTARALHHINLSSIFWFPLLALFIFRSFRAPHFRYYWILTLIYLLIVFTDYYYFIFAVCLGVLFILVYKKKAKYLIVSLLFTFLLFFPVVLQTATDLQHFHYPKKTGYDRGILDLLSFFVPPPWHTIWGNWSLHFFYRQLEINSWELVGYLGYVVLGFAFYGWKNYRNRLEIKLFSWIAVFSLLLSLGSPIHLFGKATIPSLYGLTRYFPFLGVVRIPSRWMVLVHLSLAVLFAFGAMFFLNRYRRKPFFWGILCFILVEYTCIPLPFCKVPVSSFYEKISSDSEAYAVLNVPYRVYLYSNYYMYLQTVHGKPILFGQASRVYREAYQFLEEHQIHRFCQDFQLTDLQRQVFQQYRIKYLIFHKFLVENPDRIQTLLKSQFDLVFEDQYIVVYSLF